MRSSGISQAFFTSYFVKVSQLLEWLTNNALSRNMFVQIVYSPDLPYRNHQNWLSFGFVSFSIFCKNVKNKLYDDIDIAIKMRLVSKSIQSYSINFITIHRIQRTTGWIQFTLTSFFNFNLMVSYNKQEKFPLLTVQTDKFFTLPIFSMTSALVEKIAF